LLDHIEAKNVVLNQVEYVVLDEADRMLDIGFLPDLQRILSHLPKTRTTLLFSATFSTEIKRLAGSYLQNPVTIEVARPNETAATITQQFYSVSVDDKYNALRHLIKANGMKQAFVFCNSKLGCARLARSLERDGFRTSALHGDKSQDERLKALEGFKQGEVDLLVCTDVAARGLDIKDVPAVFNFDIPFNAEDYVHRIGRTGRAGALGHAISFVSGSDQRLVGDIEKLLKTKINLETVSVEQDRSRERREPRNDSRESRGGDRGERSESSSRPRDSALSRDSRPREQDSRRSREVGYVPAPRIKNDPFFDKPYEAPVRSAEAAAPAAPDPLRKSANIKPKRVMAALFKSTT
jgi:superfamily II DNA/RNA helicase